jgi:hypothetical protein
MLMLADKRGRGAGSLVVQLREEEVRHVVESALPGVSRDVMDGEIAAPPPVSESTENAVCSEAAIRDPCSNIVEPLKQVVEKTKVLADAVDVATRVRVIQR